jgi:hypothetical protein
MLTLMFFLCSYLPRRGAELTGRLLAPAGAREAPAAGGGSVCDICVNSLNDVLFKLNV